MNARALGRISAVVPASGALTVQILNGNLRGRRLRAAHHNVTIRWSEHGAHKIPLTATVQYLLAAKEGWQTLSAGLTGRQLVIPAATFAHARRLRIRVIVTDGFSEATSTSRPLSHG
ncbi:MAG TPA: hypothetical protein VH025_06295 [Solirubrobacteraceae bacterium]|nr:hypothetical protein [Solirubrobacteraceae bacterium]